jgi:D-alanyl-D-alanine carboxypeptidase/D-alanyl-D-alanine-endopeptidase (penicillin-binding protein 4)
MQKTTEIIYLTAALIFIGCSAGTHFLNKKSESDSFSFLVKEMDERFNDSLFINAHWGVLIKSLNTGKVWYEKNSKKLFVPASNEKILTAAAAMVTLGPDFSFNTYLNYEGEISDSILNGDLIIFSNGDPTLNNNFYNNPTDIFQAWADTLKNKGIKCINGGIIGDDNAFEENPYGKGWAVDDLQEGYAPEVNALQLNGNDINLKIFPPLSINDEIKIEPDILSDYYHFINKIVIGDTGITDIRIHRIFCTNKIIFDGYVRTFSPVLMYTISVSNPTLFYVTVLKEKLEKNGIRITGNAVDSDDVPEWKKRTHNLKILNVRNSPSLLEILKLMMKQSDNLCAETLTRAMGWKKVGIGSFKEGKKLVENVIGGFGVKKDSYSYMDASGLSRYDLLSPALIVLVLEKMIKGNFSSEWYDLFPIAGIDGTLKNRMAGTKAEGNVRAKTGTMSNVRGLSGYVKTLDGEVLVFSFLVNGHLRSTKEIEYVTDSVLEAISGFVSQKP